MLIFFRLQYLHPKIADVARRFWLGALSNKGRRGQRNREELGAGATSGLRRSCARLDKTAMLRTPRSNAGACAMHSYPVTGRENFPRENLIETIAETGVTRKKVERQ